MNPEFKRIPRLKHDTQPIPQRLLQGANEIQVEQLKLWERQKQRNNESADVLNAQSELIEEQREMLREQGETLHRLTEIVEPMAKTMTWLSVNRSLAGYLAGFVTFIGVAIGALLGIKEIWKWIKGGP